MGGRRTQNRQDEELHHDLHRDAFSVKVSAPSAWLRLPSGPGYSTSIVAMADAGGDVGVWNWQRNGFSVYCMCINSIEKYSSLRSTPYTLPVQYVCKM